MSNEIEININLAGRDAFLEGVKELFPASLQEMDDLEDELLHIDMADFARTTVKAILANKMGLVQEHLEFISDLFQKANPDLENAIFVSYLENVFLGKDEVLFAKARRLLPPNLVKTLTELEEHFDKLYETSKNT